MANYHLYTSYLFSVSLLALKLQFLQLTLLTKATELYFKKAQFHITTVVLHLLRIIQNSWHPLGELSHSVNTVA